MTAYAQIINEQTKQVVVGTGTDSAYYKSIGMTQMEVEQCEWNNSWYVKGYAPEEPEWHKKESRIAKIKARLKELDEKSTRSIRAIVAKTATEEDIQYLNTIEIEVETLREELRELEG